MESQTVVLASLPLLGVALGGGLQYLFGRALETRRQLTIQRSQSYVDFFKAVALLAQNGVSKETHSMAADAKVRICIYGSESVIKHLGEFEKAGANTASAEARSVMIRLLREMRKDITKDDTLIAETELQSIVFGPDR